MNHNNNKKTKKIITSNLKTLLGKQNHPRGLALHGKKII